MDLSHILFGNVLGVARGDLLLIGVLGTVVIGTIALLYKELLLVSFDPVLAATLRLPVDCLLYTSRRRPGSGRGPRLHHRPRSGRGPGAAASHRQPLERFLLRPRHQPAGPHLQPDRLRDPLSAGLAVSAAPRIAEFPSKRQKGAPERGALLLSHHRLYLVVLAGPVRPWICLLYTSRCV